MLLDSYLISHFQTGLKNLLDRVILDSQDFHGQALVEKYKKLPFDFTRRMMSVLVEDPEGQAILLAKGARKRSFISLSVRAGRETFADGSQPYRRVEGGSNRTTITVLVGSNFCRIVDDGPCRRNCFALQNSPNN